MQHTKDNRPLTPGERPLAPGERPLDRTPATADRPLSTADLAGRGRDAEARAAREREWERQRTQSVGTALAEQAHPFFSGPEGEQFRSQWMAIQTAFVDDPRGSVQKADGLVAGVIQRLAEVFADERGRMETNWAKGTDPTTEDLRIALQRYRAFFDRLLSV